MRVVAIGRSFVSIIDELDISYYLRMRLCSELRTSIETMMPLANTPECDGVAFLVSFPISTDEHHRGIEAFEGIHQIIRSNLIRELAKDPAVAAEFLALFRWAD